MRFYIWQCSKCLKIPSTTLILAKTKTEAWDKLEAWAKHHDANSHPVDGSFLKGRIIRLLPDKQFIEKKS